MSSSPKIVISEAELQQARTSRIADVPHDSSLVTADAATSPRIWKWWLLAGVLVIQLAWLLLATSTPWNEHMSLEQIAADAQASVVMLQSETGMGTGTVISHAKGRTLLLTNKHVLGLSTPRSKRSLVECAVITRSGRQLRGELVGWAQDPDVDLALVVVEDFDECQPLRVVRFFEARVGQRVVAIGHPLGLDFTVSDGIVSAKRDGLWLQTTAPLNHGNSGGPLLSADGDLLAINTLMLEAGEGMNPCFALRADYVVQRDRWTYCGEVTDLLAAIQFR